MMPSSRRRTSILLAAAAALSACNFTVRQDPKTLMAGGLPAVPSEEPIIPNPVVVGDPAEYAPFLAGGDAVVEGQAFMKTRAGDVKLAAGNLVILDPVTTHARMWWALRGSSQTYFELPTPDSLFVRARRRTIADAQGHFRFRALAPGWYYVRSIVTWYAGTEMQGGVIGDSVLASRGATVELILTR